MVSEQAQKKFDDFIPSISMAIYARIFNKKSSPNTLCLGRIVDVGVLYTIFYLIILGGESPLDYENTISILYLSMGVAFVSLVLVLFDKFGDANDSKSRSKFFYTMLILTLTSAVFVFYLVSQLNTYATTDHNESNANQVESSYNDTPDLTNAERDRLQHDASLDGVDSSRVGDYMQLPTSEKANDTEISIKDLDDDSREYVEMIGSMFSTEKLEDYDSFLRSYDTLSLQTPEMADLFLARAITGDAPLSVFNEMLNRGAKFTGEHVSLVVTTKSLEDIKLLQNLGMDITLESSSGTNALVDALLNTERAELFDYFLSQGLAAFYESDKLMLQVIERSQELSLGNSYIEKLQDNGVSIPEGYKNLSDEP
ncbi:hypothetical protein PN836_014380 [Ningiella sp. W23]|uniref:hypothetical protein n=1 Tax=Ningiella sp. W23 TaxID=3023715 RepID=UPI003757D5D5